MTPEQVQAKLAMLASTIAQLRGMEHESLEELARLYLDALDE